MCQALVGHLNGVRSTGTDQHFLGLRGNSLPPHAIDRSEAETPVRDEKKVERWWRWWRWWKEELREIELFDTFWHFFWGWGHVWTGWTLIYLDIVKGSSVEKLPNYGVSPPPPHLTTHLATSHHLTTSHHNITTSPHHHITTTALWLFWEGAKFGEAATDNKTELAWRLQHHYLLCRPTGAVGEEAIAPVERSKKDGHEQRKPDWTPPTNQRATTRSELHSVLEREPSVQHRLRERELLERNRIGQGRARARQQPANTHQQKPLKSSIATSPFAATVAQVGLHPPAADQQHNEAGQLTLTPVGLGSYKVNSRDGVWAFRVANPGGADTTLESLPFEKQLTCAT